MSRVVGIVVISTVMLLLFDYAWRVWSFRFRRGLMVAFFSWMVMVVCFVFLTR